MALDGVWEFFFFVDGKVWDGEWKNNWEGGKKYAKGEYTDSVIANNKSNYDKQNQEGNFLKRIWQGMLSLTRNK